MTAPSSPIPAQERETEDAAIIWSGEHRAYWRFGDGKGNGYTTHVAEAGRWPRAEAERLTRHCGPEKQIEIRAVPPPAEDAAIDAALDAWFWGEPCVGEWEEAKIARMRRAIAAYHAKRKTREGDLRQCDCCGQMKADCENTKAFGMDTSACEECREAEARIKIRRRMDSMGR